METRFQTSFIPRKPIMASGPSMVSSSSHHTFGGLFMSIATFLFIASLLSVGGAFIYENYLNSVQTGQKDSLNKLENSFQSQLTELQNLQEESVKIDIAKQLLASHLAVSQLVALIGQLTSQHVRFTSLDWSAGSAGGDSTISLSGHGQSWYTVAFQSDVLGQLEQYHLKDIIKNPILSNPSESGDNTIDFNLTASVSSLSLLYEKATTSPDSQHEAPSSPL